MQDKPKKPRKSRTSKFHQAFYAAMKAFYEVEKAPVTYEQEKELGEAPVRLDLLIIKKSSDVELGDPIGKFFRLVNLCEYKSPQDGLTIDDFYKVQAYGLLYKVLDKKKVNELPIEDITITLFRHTCPKRMLQMLKKTGFEINQPYPGIYYFDGKISIPTQLIISSELPSGENYGLKLLTRNCKKLDVTNYMSHVDKIILNQNENVKEKFKIVLDFCFKLNKKIGKQIEEDENMDDAIREVFKKTFDKVAAEAAEKATKKAAKENAKKLAEAEKKVAEAKQESANFIKNMIRENIPISLIEKITAFPEETILALAK